MRKPEYLSYSALSCYESDIDEFVVRYLADQRPPREMQGQPAGVGSAFDARVKAHMYEHIYGPGYKPELYSYGALFEKQVEPQNRDFCHEAGQHVFECYRLAGFLDRLKELAKHAVDEPRFEFRIQREVGGVPLLGIPDGAMIVKMPGSERQVKLVLDFKINGYCSRNAVSPNQGYLLCRDGYIAAKQSKSHNTRHKDANVSRYHGVEIGGWLEDSSDSWASQLIGYAWCLGNEIGDEDVYSSFISVLPSRSLSANQFCVSPSLLDQSVSRSNNT